MANVTLESLMQFMLEHMVTKKDLAEVHAEMATKDELYHQTEVLQRKIENSEINLKTIIYKQRLELESCVKNEVDGLANSVGAQTHATEQRLTALERRTAGSG